MNVASSGHPTRRIGITVGLSVVAHAAALWCLRPPVVRGGAGAVAFTVAAPRVSAAAASANAATPASAAAPSAAAPNAAAPAIAPRMRVRRARRAASVPALDDPSRDDAATLPPVTAHDDASGTHEAAERQPDDASATSDAPPSEAAIEPPPSDAPPAPPAPPRTVAARNAATSASGPVAELAPAPAISIARVPSLDPGSCTDRLEYPDEAMRLGRQGVVRMVISLDERGRVLQAKVTGKAGYGFDEAAVQAVKNRCRFAPARDELGRPMPALIEHLFYFRIGDFRHRYDRND